MYDRVQKSSSSWNPSPTQKKKSSKYGPRTFTVQPRRETKSSQTPVPKNSPNGTNKRFVTLVGSIEVPVQRQANAVTLQSKSEQEAAPVEEAATISQQAQEVEVQRQCLECQEQEKDSDEMLSSEVQAKLMVGAAGDRYEQEANQVAAQVMSMSVATDNSPQVQRFGEEDNPVQGWSLARSITPVVQRAFQAGETQAAGDLESRLNASKGGGVAKATTSIQRYSHTKSCASSDLSGVVWPGDYTMRKMVDKAIRVLSTTPIDPAVAALFPKYFMTATPSIPKILAVFNKVKKVITENNYTYECVHNCGGEAAYVRHRLRYFGYDPNLHLCINHMAGYTLFCNASLILHEMTHYAAHLDDEATGCGSCNTAGCPKTLSPSDALDNTYSYANFALELYPMPV